MIPGQLAALAVVCVAAGVYYYNPGGNGFSAQRGEGGSFVGKSFSQEAVSADAEGPQLKKAGQVIEKMLTSPVTAAGGRLFKAACKEQSGNVVISPLSVVVAMSMAAAGATEGHDAGKEIRAAMEHGLVAKGSDEKAVHGFFSGLLKGIQSSDPRVEITVANSVWAQGDVLSDFKGVCQSAFDAQSHPLSGHEAINSWVEKETKGMIKKLLDKPPMGPAVLLNALYFKGEWKTKFDESKTTKAEFRGFNGASRPCMMMKSDDKHTLHVETDYAHLVVLPYGAGRFNGIVALPKEEGEVMMAEAIDKLFAGAETFSETLTGQLAKHVKLQLPRFKVDYGPTSLKPALQSMGVKSGFQQTKGFLRMSADPSVYIDDVLHKAVIEVNEAGTEAAAATAVRMTRSLPPPATEVTVDRPFVFAVHDAQTDSLIFVARVVNPELP